MRWDGINTGWLGMVGEFTEVVVDCGRAGSYRGRWVGKAPSLRPRHQAFDNLIGDKST